MTPAERVDPDSIDGSRRTRIAAGSGAQPAQVSELLKQFREVSKMMKRMGGLGSKRKKKARKAKKGAKQSKGRVTPKGKPSLQLPSFDPEAMPSLEDLQGDGLPGLR